MVSEEQAPRREREDRRPRPNNAPAEEHRPCRAKEDSDENPEAVRGITHKHVIDAAFIAG
jgi:hypothetical protein